MLWVWLIGNGLRHDNLTTTKKGFLTLKLGPCQILVCKNWQHVTLCCCRNRVQIKKKVIKKIPHTGHKASLDQCGE